MEKILFREERRRERDSCWSDKGRRLNHALIGMAAAVGKGRVMVYRKPRVAVLSTGDELVGIEATPGAAQIRNSNSYSLAAQIAEVGGEAVQLAIAPDKPARMRALIEEGLACDLLLLTGGVSMGKYDLVEQVLGEIGAEFYFTGAKIQPGKPVVFGSCGPDAPAREGADAADTRAGAPSTLRAGPPTLFLWPAGKSDFYDGDIPAFRPTDDRGSGGHEARAADFS